MPGSNHWNPRLVFGGTSIYQGGALPAFLVVVWDSSGFDLGVDDFGVFGQIISGSNPYYGDNFRVNSTLAGHQLTTSGAGGIGIDWTTGQFTVGWQGNGPGDSDGVFSQRFSIIDNEAPQVTPATLQAVQNRPITIDLRSLASDQHSSDDELTFEVPSAQGGTADLQADGHTVLFTPGQATQDAGFQFTVVDNGLDGLPPATASGEVHITIFPEFVDDDGDRYAITSSGRGKFAVLLDDPDEDGRGPIERITAIGTNPTNSRISIIVRKSETGDGIVRIGEIRGDGFHSLTAGASDLLAGGIDLSGPLRSLILRDVAAGAAIRAMGLATMPASIRLRDLADNTLINLGPALGHVSVRNVGTANFQAGSMAGLIVTGSFAGNLNLSGAAQPAAFTLGPVLIQRNLTDSTWNVGGRIRQIRINGQATHWLLTGNSSYSTNAIALNTALRVQLNLPEALVNNFTVKSFTDSTWNSRAVGLWKSSGEIQGSTIQISQLLGRAQLNVLSDSQVLLNYVVVNDAAPLDGGNFVSETRLGSLVVNRFDNSTVAAATVGRIVIRSLAIDMQPELFGMIADETIGAISVLSPRLTWHPKLGHDQGLNSFRIRLI